jgi:hypothetical protein
MSKPSIKLMPDYQCYPLWHYRSPQVGCIDPRDVGVSESLVADLLAWAEEYDSHMNWSDPAAARWSAEETAAFDTRGRHLACRVAREIGSRYKVFYFDRVTQSCVAADPK